MYDIFHNRGSLHQRDDFAKDEKSRLVYKGIQRLVELPRYVRMANTSTFGKETRNSSIVRIKNRCLITNRQRGMVTKHKISRLQFRRMSRNGLLKGLRQSSW